MSLHLLRATVVAALVVMTAHGSGSKPKPDALVPQTSSGHDWRASTMHRLSRDLVFLKLQLRGADAKSEGSTGRTNRAVQGTREILRAYIVPTMAKSSQLSRAQMADMEELLQAHLEVLQKITGLPNTHPCASSGGACLRGPGSVCLTDEELNWACGCASEYRCAYGCDKKQSPHLCELAEQTSSLDEFMNGAQSKPTSRPTFARLTPFPTKAPTPPPTPTSAPTKAPTSTPTLEPTASTQHPTKAPTFELTMFPTKAPTKTSPPSPPAPPPPVLLSSTKSPTESPSTPPDFSLTMFPTKAPSGPKLPPLKLMEWHQQEYEDGTLHEGENADRVDISHDVEDPLEEAIEVLSLKTKGRREKSMREGESDKS